MVTMTYSVMRLLFPVLLVVMAGVPGAVYAEQEYEVVASSDVVFQPLNPARGDASPRAGALWGDIRQGVPSGVLIKFADGFSSPPHIHNITYRAVVISGTVHNDDPNAAAMWMGPGSFWTQPAGEPHITAAGYGAPATAFLEILDGPYLVRPAEEAFDNGERPMNLSSGNVVWLSSEDVTWIDQSEESADGDGPKIAFLWGSHEAGQDQGTFLKLPAKYSGTLQGNASWIRTIVIKGRISHQIPGKTGLNELTPGSYFGAKGSLGQDVSCLAEDECLLYVRNKGKFSLSPIRR